MRTIAIAALALGATVSTFAADNSEALRGGATLMPVKVYFK